MVDDAASEWRGSLGVLWVAAFAVAGISLHPATSFAQPALPSITVQGSCSASVLPDRASVAVTAERRGPEVGRVIADATAAYNQFRAGVQKLRLPDLVLDSSGVQVGRIDDDDAKRRPAVFSATAGLTVETSSLEGLALVMREAALDRITDIGPMQSFMSGALRERLIADCLPKAAADAAAKATALLRGLGSALGRVQRVDGIDTGGESMRPMAKAPGMMRAAMAQPTAVLSAGPQTITVTTTVTFLIDPANTK